MYWTTHRFSPAVVESIDQIVSRLKQRSGAEHLTLIGYSGGGAIAALVAARRHDVDRLITVAGNLEPREWVREKGLQPLEGSLDPSDDIQALGAIRQWHFVGGRDTTVPPPLTEEFADRFAPSVKPKVIAIDDYGHACCWADHWSELWTTYGLGATKDAP
jgi:dienelactone hydrolase